ncbi:hypothetical protein MBT84_08910 [Streptomyces sp. MBT84]|nr:hypothetical protein [Streptomyces sp. MBT84]
MHALSPSGSRHKPLQAGGVVLAFGTTLALLAVGRRRGDPSRAPARAALWGWCPAVPFEAVNNAHIDTLGVLLTVLALGTATAGTRRGALLGAAIAVKLLPVLALPGALAGQRSPARVARVASAVIAAVALAYLPYVVASGTGVLGYLPGYLQEEGYEPGDVHRFALLRLLLPDAAAGATVVVLLALTALYVWWRGDPARPWRGALVLTGTALLLVSPSYPWYSLLVVGLVALDGRWEWLTVTMAGTVLYLGGSPCTASPSRRGRTARPPGASRSGPACAPPGHGGSWIGAGDCAREHRLCAYPRTPPAGGRFGRLTRSSCSAPAPRRRNGPGVVAVEEGGEVAFAVVFGGGVELVGHLGVVDGAVDGA